MFENRQTASKPAQILSTPLSPPKPIFSRTTRPAQSGNTEDRAGHIEQPRPLCKIANSFLFISARVRAVLELGKAAFDSHSIIDYP